MTMPSTTLQQQAADIWASGGLCLVACQIGYVLAGLPIHVGALQRIAACKDSHASKALPCFAQSFELIEPWLPLPKLCRTLAEQFWPEQLAFVVEPPQWQERLTSFGGRMAVQGLPSGWISSTLTGLGGLLAAWPLLDDEGRPCLDLQKGDRFAIGLVDQVIDEGPLPVSSVDATVLAFRGQQPVLLRQGNVAQPALEQLLGQDVWIA